MKGWPAGTEAEEGAGAAEAATGTAEPAARLPPLEEIVPVFHIALRTESTISETLDVERDSLTELRIELAHFVGELLKAHAQQLWVDEDWRVDVTDDSGLILFVIQISASDTAATRPLKPSSR